MAILAGIDEAGVGPRLGPLVAAAVTWAGPPKVLGESLWEALAPAVSPSQGSLVIADSKRLYRGQRDRAGFRRLEHAVLAVAGTAGKVPGSLGELMARMSASGAADATPLPFYQGDALPLPRAADPAAIQRDSQRLAGRLRELGLQPPLIACDVVNECAFNRLLADTGGKGEALLAVDARLLRRLPEDDGEVHLDRLGGRRRYGPWLQGVFPRGFVWILGEDASVSRYRVTRASGASLEVCVTVGCEARQLPVALASMVAKYIRELHMELLNRFWAARVPGLTPTAGYPVDAARFVGQIAAVAREEGLDLAEIVRRR
ncbi:MAG: hypothetical protein HRF46_10970 [Acidobacteriota bacterium]|jgi:ribonuclease HII